MMTSTMRDPKMQLQTRTSLRKAATTMAVLLSLSGCATSTVTPPVNESLYNNQWHHLPRLALQTPVQTAKTQPRLPSELRTLIQRVLENNRDLQVAAIRVNAARNAAELVAADARPTFTGTQRVTRTRISRREISANTASSENIDVTAAKNPSNRHAAAVSFGYEVDLWGRINAAKSASGGEFQATMHDKNAAQISIAAEVAEQYVQALTSHAVQQSARVQVQLINERRRIADARFQLGTATSEDINRIERDLSSAQTDATESERGWQTALNRLSLLLGERVIERDIGMVLPEFALSTSSEIDLPAIVMLRRPDVAAALARAHAAGFRLQELEASRWPRLLLNLEANFAANTFANLFTRNALGWILAPQITGAIWDAGRNTNRQEGAKIDQHRAVIEWEQVTLRALNDVEQSLINMHTSNARLNQTSNQLVQAEHLVKALQIRHALGRNNKSDLLLAQQDLHAAKQSVLRERANQTVAQIALNRALALPLAPNSFATDQPQAQ